MSVSAWGVEHGEISKKREKFNTREKVGGAISATPGIGPVGGSVYAGVKAKKGKGAKVGFRALGRGMAQGTAAGTVGGLVGQGLARGNKAGETAGQLIAGLPAAGHGVAASMRNSRRKGWMKD
jgi:hypothetical protein